MILKSTTFLLAILLILITRSNSQRIVTTINSNWSFFKGDTINESADSRWQDVSLPHTWNVQDVSDDEPGYYRGDGWYKKILYIPVTWKDKDVYILFEGAAQIAEVFINGHSIGKHTGSYTFFTFPLTKFLHFGDGENAPNILTVKVNNSADEKIPPNSGDYTFFGGIYRDVYLRVYDKVHFDADNNASEAIFITTPVVSASYADVNIKRALFNSGSVQKKLKVTNTMKFLAMVRRRIMLNRLGMMQSHQDYALLWKKSSRLIQR